MQNNWVGEGAIFHGAPPHAKRKHCLYDVCKGLNPFHSPVQFHNDLHCIFNSHSLHTLVVPIYSRLTCIYAVYCLYSCNTYAHVHSMYTHTHTHIQTHTHTHTLTHTHMQFHMIAIIAEGIPENKTKRLIKRALEKKVAIIGPATVSNNILFYVLALNICSSS